MIRVYYLEAITENDVNSVKGIDLIHDAILQVTEEPGVRLLIMDTTSEEHDALQAVALQVHNPTPTELELYNATVKVFEKDLDTLRAEELLELSPAVITQPEIWELLRIYGRHLGYSF